MNTENLCPIIENPDTKELYLKGCGGVIHSFDGTAIRRSIENWKTVSHASSVLEWATNPGNYKTLYGSMDVVMWDATGERYDFTMGENISYLLNWVIDAEANGCEVHTINKCAYSDRNVARSKFTMLNQ